MPWITDMLKSDYVIVGSGLTGATIAKFLHAAGREVIVIEKRKRVGGNVSDEIHPSGFRYNLYGPHYFRTNNVQLWEYAQRFGEFFQFEAVVKTMVDGEIHNWPITEEMIGNFSPPKLESDGSFETEHLLRFPEEIYRKFIKSYTEKQWGIPASKLEAPLRRKLEIRTNGDNRLSTKKYQGIPLRGYTAWVDAMLEGICVFTDMDYTEHRENIVANKSLIFTGPIDAYFDYTHGKLPSRSQRRENFLCNSERVLPTCQLNYPSPTLEFIRLIEWKHIWRNDSRKSLLTSETPIDGGDEYPFPSKYAAAMYSKYRAMADSLDGVRIEGRCGRYVYLDMDQSISHGISVAKDIIKDGG